jgi:hypothetical protein
MGPGGRKWTAYAVAVAIVFAALPPARSGGLSEGPFARPAIRAVVSAQAVLAVQERGKPQLLIPPFAILPERFGAILVSYQDETPATPRPKHSAITMAGARGSRAPPQLLRFA